MKIKLLILSLFLSVFASAQEWDVILPPYQVETARALAFSQTRDWGHSYLQATEFTKSQGVGAYIFILDTGIKTDHPDLAANVDTKYARDFTNSANGYQDANGHGTHCAGIAAAINNQIGVIGIAPKARLVPIKVLNDSGSGSYSWIASGIRYVADLKLSDGTKKIISMSLGGSQGSTELYDAVKYAISKGVFVIAAAGNSYCNSDETIGFPGNYHEVITVASLDKNEAVSAFSSCGANVDVIAPGSGIYSTHLGDNYAYLSGTSMATPQIAGIAALLTTTYDIKTQATLEVFLRKYAKDLAPKGFDKRSGYGAAIATRYTQSPGDNPIDTTPTPPPPPPTVQSRVITMPVTAPVRIFWSANDNEFTYAEAGGILVEFTTNQSDAVAAKTINAFVSQFFVNRGFVIPNNQKSVDWAGKWAFYFLELIAKQNGLNIRVKEAWVTRENDRTTLNQYDKNFQASTTQMNKLAKSGRASTLKW